MLSKLSVVDDDDEEEEEEEEVDELDRSSLALGATAGVEVEVLVEEAGGDAASRAEEGAC